jgi:hypothetical protein
VTGWTGECEGYEAADERLREPPCTPGYGCFATRGALPECAADGVRYPGTYAAGWGTPQPRREPAERTAAWTAVNSTLG